MYMYVLYKYLLMLTDIKSMHINKFNWLINGALGVIRAAQLNGRTDQWLGAENRTGARTARIQTGAPTSSTDMGGGLVDRGKNICLKTPRELC